MRRFLAIPLLVVFIAACSDSSPTEPQAPGNPDVTGSWTGTLQQVVGFQLTLTESGNSVSGSGTLSQPGAQLAISVTGTHVYPNISLTFRAPGTQDSNFSGTVSSTGNAITGTVSGSGFNNQGLTLNRQ